MKPTIVLDLDGTLLKNDKSISEYTAEVLRSYSRIGKIIVATGRSIYRIGKYTSQFDTVGSVNNNGGAIYKGNELIKKYDIDPDTIKTLVHRIQALGETEISVWYPTTNLCTNPEYARPNGPTYYSTLEDFDTNEIQKITVFTKEREGMLKIDYHEYGCKLLLNAHELDFFAIMNEEVNKHKGLMDLFEALDIDPKTAIAFGDDFNDLDMFELCGKSVAVANAPDVIKEKADFICPSNEDDGVAHWIEENLLNEK